MKASAFVVGPRDGAGSMLMDLAQAVGFDSVQRYQGLARADKQVSKTPLVFFLCAPAPGIAMGFDDVIALPIGGDDVSDRIARQIGRIQTYYETSTYFGPDRRNRTGGPERGSGSDHGGGQFRRIEIVRNPETGIDVISDDMQVVL